MEAMSVLIAWSSGPGVGAAGSVTDGGGVAAASTAGAGVSGAAVLEATGSIAGEYHLGYV